MSELISGKDVLVALGEGKSVQYKYNGLHKCEWLDLKPVGWCLIEFLAEDYSGRYLFRLKPRTITINGADCQGEAEAIKLVKEFFNEQVN